MSLYYSTLRNGEDLYLVLYTQRDPGMNDQSKLHVWKKHFNADTIFRRNGSVYYCVKIEEAEVIEYTTYTNEEIDFIKKAREETSKAQETSAYKSGEK